MFLLHKSHPNSTRRIREGEKTKFGAGKRKTPKKFGLEVTASQTAPGQNHVQTMFPNFSLFKNVFESCGFIPWTRALHPGGRPNLRPFVSLSAPKKTLNMTPNHKQHQKENLTQKHRKINCKASASPHVRWAPPHTNQGGNPPETPGLLCVCASSASLPLALDN